MKSWFEVKSPEQKEDDCTRGSYSPVGDSHYDLKINPSIGRRLFRLTPTIGIPFIAAALMVLHHAFYTHLNEKRIEPGTTELLSFLQSQRNVNIIGTTIAHGARIMLSTALGIIFAQMFWVTLRRQSHTIAQIDALVNCGQSPFRPSALRAARASFVLFVVSLVASSTALVVVLSPGSLTIDSDFPRRSICLVPTVPQEAMTSDNVVENTFDETMEALLEGIVSTYSYLPPFQSNAPSACGNNTSCSYNVTFLAPALNCVNVTNETDFSSFSSPTDNEPGLPFTIWNTTSPNSDIVGITILSRDLEKDLLEANQCTAYNATYDVGVSLEGGSATIHVWNVTQGSSLPSKGSFKSDFGMSAMQQLSNLCDTTPGDPGFCLNSPLFVSTPTGNQTFREPVSHFATTFMQNVSLSLLSGNVYYGFSNDTATNLEYIASTCSSIATVYVYNPTRLLLTYGIALAVTAVIVSYGCLRFLDFDDDRGFIFSNLIKLALNEKMALFIRETCVDGRTQIQLLSTGSMQHKIVPVPPSGLDPPIMHNSTHLSARMRRISAVQRKMLALIIATMGCMILNHAYYRYLDGKQPGLPLNLSNSSGWLLNQTVASDVGIALAYTGQTFLAVTIIISCAQLFWRALRRQGHGIFQVDALMKAQTNPSSTSIFAALRTSMGVSLAALLAASMSMISIFAPGSLRVASNHNHSEDCTVLAPRDLSALATNSTLYENVAGNIVPALTALTAGTYLPPINVCGSEPSTSQCAYDIQLVGPGLVCEDVTASSNFTAFSTAQGPNTEILCQGEITPQTSPDQSWQFFFQTWDLRRSVYQAVNCTGVLRSYNISVFHTTSSTIDVIASQIISTVYGNMSQPTTFADNYLHDIMTLLGSGNQAFINFTSGDVEANLIPMLSFTSEIGTTQLDGNVTFNANMTRALEEFAQNATLSVLSGQISALNADIPSILENVTTTCSYTFTAYEYSPYRLFLTYGIGILIAAIFALCGSVAIRRNGVDETMDFSRILRAVLNERMFNAKETLNKDTIIRADETEEGAIAPVGL